MFSNMKSLGEDGFTVEFHVQFFELLTPDLLASLNVALQFHNSMGLLIFSYTHVFGRSRVRLLSGTQIFSFFHVE